jgi:PAS domain S-box-containing protein
VASGSFNSKRQFITTKLLVPALDQVRTLAAARSDLYSLPVTSLASLGHRAEKRPGERIHIQGVVTLLLPGEALYVREGTSSIEVRTSEMGGAKPGDQVDVIGFYGKTDHALVIEDGSFRRLATGPAPLPLAVTMEEIATGRADAELVTVPAVALEWRHGPSERTLLLRGTNNVIFKARLNDANNIEEFPAGSLLQVTGVCSIAVDQNLDVRSFELRLRSADDLMLLERPAWWTPSRVLWALGALAIGAAITLGWAGVLKCANARLERHVAERTEELGRSEARFRKLAACLPVGVMETDARGNCTYVNQRGTEILGRPSEEPAGWAWSNAVYPDDREMVARSWLEAAAAGEAWSLEFRLLRPDGRTCWVSCSASPRVESPGEIAGYVATFADITRRKQDEAALEEAHKELVVSSRLAGMAEVATSVLHNVGNVLTSINISSSLLMDRVRNSRVASLGKAAALIRDHADDLPAFFARDPKGKQLPAYLTALAELLLKDHGEMLEELELLSRNIEHINDIVAMQQNYGKVAGVVEELPLAGLVEDALRMNLGSMERHGVQVVREYDKVPAVQVDKRKVLQILVNLIRNAKQACDERGQAGKRIILRVGLNGDNRVRISVIDNGIGIPPENLAHIFARGFTTRKDGHGFGLHSGALAAKELGGALLVQSDGPGQGAVFTLELPLQPASPDRN